MPEVTLRDDDFPNDEEVFIVGSNKTKPESEPEFTPPAEPKPAPAPAPAPADAAPTDTSLEDDMDKYSQGVQKRMNQLTHRYHDERRAKEALEMQNQEAIRIAQAILVENERLQKAYNDGSQDYIKQVQYKIQYAEKLAEDKFRKAYEAGDTEGLIEAQRLRDEIAVEKAQLANFHAPQPAPQPAPQQAPLQTVQQPVYNQQSVAPQQPQAPQRDTRAEEWAAANPWFGADEEMTSLAYGLHAKLVNSGVSTQSDEYYNTINKRMRDVFPDYFGLNKPRASSPVAPAGRTATTAGKNETLNETQKAVARKLGVPYDLYAKHVKKLQEQANG